MNDSLESVTAAQRSEALPELPTVARYT
jgi:hypothetical protein